MCLRTIVASGILLYLFLSPVITQAETYGTTCYCGARIKGEATNEDCIEACGDNTSSSGGGGSYNNNNNYWQSEHQRRREREQEERWQREEEERQRKLEELKEAEEESARRAAEAHEQFLLEQKAAIESLKGTHTGTLQVKGSVMGKPFSTQATPDVELKIPGRDTARVPSAWAQLYRGAWISGFALKAATPPPGKPIDIDEVRYLAEQAVIAMDGGEIAVQCPPVPPPPKPYGPADLGPDSAALKFYRTLLPLVEKEAETAHQAEQQIWKSEIKRHKTERALTEKKEAVARITKEIQELEAKPGPPVSEGGAAKEAAGAEEAKEKKKRALEAALKAREQAEKALNAVQQRVATAEKQLAESQANLGTFESMYNTVQADPAKVSEYMESIGK